ncbi:MAG: hypothetical protein MI757_00915 [Pirellulales bacterium]|nr:hypothetical protein [Pirellulales bacterium]
MDSTHTRECRDEDMQQPELMDRIMAILKTMRVPLDEIDLRDTRHVGRLIRELPHLNLDHPQLDEVRGLLKTHRFVNDI